MDLGNLLYISKLPHHSSLILSASLSAATTFLAFSSSTPTGRSRRLVAYKFTSPSAARTGRRWLVAWVAAVRATRCATFAAPASRGRGCVAAAAGRPCVDGGASPRADNASRWRRKCFRAAGAACPCRGARQQRCRRMGSSATTTELDGPAACVRSRRSMFLPRRPAAATQAHGRLRDGNGPAVCVPSDTARHGSWLVVSCLGRDLSTVTRCGTAR